MTSNNQASVRHLNLEGVDKWTYMKITIKFLAKMSTFICKEKNKDFILAALAKSFITLFWTEMM